MIKTFVRKIALLLMLKQVKALGVVDASSIKRYSVKPQHVHGIYGSFYIQVDEPDHFVCCLSDDFDILVKFYDKKKHTRGKAITEYDNYIKERKV